VLEAIREEREGDARDQARDRAVRERPGERAARRPLSARDRSTTTLVARRASPVAAMTGVARRPGTSTDCQYASVCE
jgi:hypothetical protein